MCSVKGLRGSVNEDSLPSCGDWNRRIKSQLVVRNVTDSVRRAVYTQGMSLFDEHGKVKVKFFIWPSIIISIVLSVIGTIILNIIF